MSEKSDESLLLPRIHHQIGAPALIYRQKIDRSNAFVQVAGHKYPNNRSDDIEETIQRRNRLATRWFYPTQDIPTKEKKKTLHTEALSSSSEEEKLDDSSTTDAGSDPKIVDNRKKILQHHNLYTDLATGQILDAYQQHDRPYSLVRKPSQLHRKDERNFRLDSHQRVLGSDIACQRMDFSDPAYLAPFGFEALNEMVSKTNHEKKYGMGIDRQKTDCFGNRPRQGNSLLCMSCPCPNCHLNPSWCLIHPKGTLLDTLCVSNLLLPNGKINAGHIYSVATWHKDTIKPATIRTAQKNFPNELCVGDTILEIKQSGSWHSLYPSGMFVVRTSCYVLLVQITVTKPTSSTKSRKGASGGDFAQDTCWGNYVIKECQRFDLRSLTFNSPSYKPISTACHPKYGNDIVGSRIAFVTYAEHSNTQNTIFHYDVDSSSTTPIQHTIASLREISEIEFSMSHPLCLWSAATSYVRPALVEELWFPKQYPLNFGTSLYSVDLRANSSMFQWSPSAEEMKVEGTHSISGIFNDWESENRLWVSSRSAGKTWEIDSRMPVKAINSWSLGADCDYDSATFPERGPFGDPILLTQVKSSSSNQTNSSDSNMILTADTTPASFGIQLLQKPLHQARFLTDCLECTEVPYMDQSKGQPSIATTGIFAMPEQNADLFTCGLACLRLPMKEFLSLSGGNDKRIGQVFKENIEADVLCSLSMNNKGDILCHSLLETTKSESSCQSFPGLPEGTAVIPVPTSKDGYTNPVEHKRWKPTGGMNLKLFWTNQYPTPRDAKSFLKPSVSKIIYPPKKPLERHISTRATTMNKSKGTKTVERTSSLMTTTTTTIPPPPPPPSSYEIKYPQSGNAISIAAPPTGGIGLVNTDHSSLVITKTLVDKAFSTRLSFGTDTHSKKKKTKTTGSEDGKVGNDIHSKKKEKINAITMLESESESNTVGNKRTKEWNIGNMKGGNDEVATQEEIIDNNSRRIKRKTKERNEDDNVRKQQAAKEWDNKNETKGGEDRSTFISTTAPATAIEKDIVEDLPKSDLNLEMITKISRTWDQWNDLDKESDASDEDGSVHGKRRMMNLSGFL